ncbi:hypothetical protein QIS74_07020 [Colletotrichum tabaci]|uniref:Uncharacterized protein n=1 Tax=Colletotrichum tabaci TaxID=1209068 RepID=A0AAV9TD88_9PEZI
MCHSIIRLGPMPAAQKPAYASHTPTETIDTLLRAMHTLCQSVIATKDDFDPEKRVQIVDMSQPSSTPALANDNVPFSVDRHPGVRAARDQLHAAFDTAQMAVSKIRELWNTLRAQWWIAVRAVYASIPIIPLQFSYSRFDSG